jgi:uridine kinase
MFNADADVRLARRIKRDTADNARNIEAVLDQVA